MLKEEIVNIEKILMDHMYNMGILKEKDEKKKKNAILDPLIGILIREGYNISKIEDFIKDVEEDKVLDLSIFDIGGSFLTYVDEKWHNLLKSLWRLRSVGLGTPNAASGEGEFMFVFSSKYLTKPKKGDLLNNKNKKLLELKGEQARLTGKKTGKEFNKKVIELAKKMGLTPNISAASTKNNTIYGVEIEKTMHKKYWEDEIKKLDIIKQKEFIGKWLNCIDDEDHTDSILKIFENGNFNQKALIKEIVIILYLGMETESTLIMLGDGSDIQIVTNDIEVFKQQIYDDKIPIHKDYFRINQNNPIAWYLY